MKSGKKVNQIDIYGAENNLAEISASEVVEAPQSYNSV